MSDAVAPDVGGEARADPGVARPAAFSLAQFVRVVTFASFVVVFAAAVVGNWLRVQDVDPEYAYDLVQRTLRFGGSYYANGIQDKGPLEPFVYHVAALVTSHNGFWYAIAFFVAVAAAMLGAAAARTARDAGASRNLALAAAAVMFVHFTYSGADYAGVLYARNMNVALLAFVWVVALSQGPWATSRRALATMIVGGGVLGLVVQTLIPNGAEALPVGVMLLGAAWSHRPREEQRTLFLASVASAVAVFLSAPAWYLVRGQWTEFFSGWWTYAGFLSTSTGRSLGNQIGLGWNNFYAYYQDHPIVALAILGFLAMVVIDWPLAGGRRRLLYGCLIAWFVGAWVELVLGQRYSSHYFAVSSVPTGLMIAALAGRVYRALVTARGPFRGTVAWPMVALVLSIYFWGPQTFVDSVHDLSSFTSVHSHQVQVERAQSGPVRSVRAVLDLVSKNRDPLLVWTNDPWPYIDYDRVSATRFIWASFLTGKVYLGRQSDAYVLAHSWDWFRADLARSKPLAYVHSGFGDVPSGSPFAAYVADQFTLAYPDPKTPVYLQKSVVAQVLDPPTPTPWTAPEPGAAPTGWSVDGSDAAFTDHGQRDKDRLALASDSCFSLRGSVSSDGPPGGVTFHFDDRAGKFEPVKLVFEGDAVASASDNVEFARLPSHVTNDEPTEFTLVVGRRSAALVVGGQIRAALRLPPSVRVSVTAARSHLQLQGLTLGAAPAGSGC